MATYTLNQFLSKNSCALSLFKNAPQRAQLSTLKINKSMTLLSNDETRTPIEKCTKPLTIMPAWLLANSKHLRKYSDIYLNRGCDVLQVTITPMQLLWPTKGSHIIASQILKYLTENFKESPLFIHGFSVGGYLWGEVLVQMASEGDKYKSIIERFVAQIWDSTADIQDIPYGFSRAVFPKNEVMANALMKYTMYHMKAFDSVATRHYVRSSQMFHTNLIRAPALFLASETDLVAPLKTICMAKETWESMGMKVKLKTFKDSAHVSHMYRHPKEYTDTVIEFLDDAVGLQDMFAKEKLQVKC